MSNTHAAPTAADSSAQSQPKIYVAGHRGMVGSAIVRTLLAQGTPADHIVTRTHAELDLCNQAAVQAFFAQEKPDQVYLAAVKVGGIYANNTYSVEQKSLTINLIFDI